MGFMKEQKCLFHEPTTRSETSRPGAPAAASACAPVWSEPRSASLVDLLRLFVASRDRCAIISEISRIHERLGDVISVELWPVLRDRLYFLANPHHIKHIQCSDDFQISRTRVTSILEHWIGAESMTIYSGADAQEKRHTLYDPVFNRRIVHEQYMEIIAQQIDAMMGSIARCVATDQPVNMTDESWKLWLRVLFCVLTPSARPTEADLAEFRALLEVSGKSITSLFFSMGDSRALEA